MSKQDNLSAVTAFLILIAGISAIGLVIPRYDTGLILLAYFSSFVGYFWFCKFISGFNYVLSAGVLCRLLLFFAMPNLSDDVYRFIWDGYLLAEGVSPFANLPGAYVNSNIVIPGVTRELYQNLNSPEYYTVYPPFNQFIFWLSVQIKNSWLFSANVIRAILLLADIGAFLMLRKVLAQRKRNPSLANWYFLNPLVILEFTGNLHFEGLVIFFLVSGLYYLIKNKPVLSGLGFGMAVATKLLPLIYLPALLFTLEIRKGLLVCSVAVLVALISFLPMLDEAFIHGLQSSIGLYINKFEFNGSIYLLLREIGYWITGYNIIGILGPFLSFCTVTLIIWLAFHAKKHLWPVEKTMLFSLTIYLLLATTVHPWYIIPLIVFGLLSGYYFPIVWSLMIFVTYFGYTNEGFELSPLWIVFEYVIVLSAIIFEASKKTHEEIL